MSFFLLVGSGLSGQKKLQVIRLDHNKIESITWSDINGCNRLIQLDISDNLVKMFLGRCALEHLEELKVANNQLTTAPDITGCKMVGLITMEEHHLFTLSNSCVN